MLQICFMITMPLIEAALTFHIDTPKITKIACRCHSQSTTKRKPASCDIATAFIH